MLLTFRDVVFQLNHLCLWGTVNFVVSKRLVGVICFCYGVRILPGQVLSMGLGSLEEHFRIIDLREFLECFRLAILTKRS